MINFPRDKNLRKDGKFPDVEYLEDICTQRNVTLRPQEVTVLLFADVVRCLELCANIYPPYTTTHFLKKMQGNCMLSEKLNGTKDEG